jgi:hypothetical protein
MATQETEAAVVVGAGTSSLRVTALFAMTECK